MSAAAVEISSGIAVPELPAGVGPQEAAFAYASGGFYVAPILPGTKRPSLGDKWQTLTSNQIPVIEGWYSGKPEGYGVALHHSPSGTVAFDIDVPDNAPPELLRFVSEYQPPVQRTRDDSDRVHIIAAVPPGRRFGNSVGGLRGPDPTRKWGDVRGSGITIVAPTVHPEGGHYHWLRTGSVPILASYVADLLPDAAPGELAASSEEVQQFAREHASGDRTAFVAGMLAVFARDCGRMARHDAAVNAACMATREARAGAYPAGDACTALREAFVIAMAQARGTERLVAPGAARMEFARIWAWAVGQALTLTPEECRAKMANPLNRPPRTLNGTAGVATVSPLKWPPTAGAPDDAPPVAAPAQIVQDESETQPGGMARFLLPASVWEHSPLMQHIYKAAMARLVSPDALLHAVFAIVASLLHHKSRIDTGKGGSVFSYYLAAVGASGAGKSEALKVARELLEDWSADRFAITAGDGYVEGPLGSGEGLVEAFMGELIRDKIGADGHPMLNQDGSTKTEKIRAQVRHNGLFHTDEGRQVLAIDSRKGATVLAVMCEMWSGSVAGQTNAEAARTRKLTAGSYVVGMMLGFQTATIDALFADEAGGAPQRFAFAPAEYAPFADDLDNDDEPEWPGALKLNIPVDPIGVQLSTEQRREVRRHVKLKAAGLSGDGPLDGHRMLMRCRVAGLLALLHGEHTVSDDTWNLSDVIVSASCSLRDWLAELGTRRVQEQAAARQREAVETHVRAAARAAANDRTVRAAGQIARAVERAGGVLTRGKALNGIRGDLRDVRDQALDYAAETGLVVLSQDGRTVTLAPPE